MDNKLVERPEDLVNKVIGGCILINPEKTTSKSIIYQVYNISLDAIEAMKILIDPDPERQDQFIEEGIQAAQIRGIENLAEIYDADIDEETGLRYIRYQYIRNEIGDFEDEINAGKRYSLEEVVTRITDTLNGAVGLREYKKKLDIEEEEKWHGDIKPKNMKWDEILKKAFLIDYGMRLSHKEYEGDVVALGNSLLKLIKNCDQKVPKKLQKILGKAVNNEYADVTYFKNAFEKYKKNITRREFFKKSALVGGGGLLLLGSAFSIWKYLNHLNSIDYIIKKISKVKATDYNNINPLFKELLFRTIDHKVDWLFEDGKIEKDRFPYATIENGSWFLTEGGHWTDGFLPGILWGCYEVTRKEKYKQLATERTKAIKFTDKEKNDIRSIRFYYSHAKAYELTKDTFFRDSALKAADFMAYRLDRKTEDKKFVGIDSIMTTLPILWWAYNETGDKKYYNIALEHTNNVRKFLLRNDGSTIDSATFNPLTGERNEIRGHPL